MTNIMIFANILETLVVRDEFGRCTDACRKFAYFPFYDHLASFVKNENRESRNEIIDSIFIKMHKAYLIDLEPGSDYPSNVAIRPEGIQVYRMLESALSG